MRGNTHVRCGVGEKKKMTSNSYLSPLGDQGGARSFAEILSEARKYRLGLIVANQFIEQLRQSGGNFLLHALFNNCGTTITFRVGGLDAPFFEDIYFDKEANTGYKRSDIVDLGLGEVVMQVMLPNGTRSKPFMAKTFAPATASKDANPQTIIENSRSIIGRPRSIISRDIRDRMALDSTISDN